MAGRDRERLRYMHGVLGAGASEVETKAAQEDQLNQRGEYMNKQTTPTRRTAWTLLGEIAMGAFLIAAGYALLVMLMLF